MCYGQGMLKWVRKMTIKVGVKLDSSRCVTNQIKEILCLNFRVWAVAFADRTIKGDYLAIALKGLNYFQGGPEQTRRDDAHISQRWQVAEFHTNRLTSEKAFLHFPYQNHLISSSKWRCKKHIMQLQPLPSRGLQSKMSKPGSNKQRKC